MATNEEIKKYSEILSKNSIKCKCGHSIAMNPELNKQICTWCGNYIFRTPKDEFQYRLIQNLKKVNK